MSVLFHIHIVIWSIVSVRILIHTALEVSGVKKNQQPLIWGSERLGQSQQYKRKQSWFVILILQCITFHFPINCLDLYFPLLPFLSFHPCELKKLILVPLCFFFLSPSHAFPSHIIYLSCSPVLLFVEVLVLSSRCYCLSPLPEGLKVLHSYPCNGTNPLSLVM